MTRIAFGIVIGSVLYATACLLAFHPEGAVGPYTKANPGVCSCR